MTLNYRSDHTLDRGEAFEDVVMRRQNRRSFLKKSVAAAPLLVLSSKVVNAIAQTSVVDGLSFQPIHLGTADTVVAAPGYSTQVFLRWGDPLFIDSPAFDPENQTAESQKRQFGYNNDFLAFFPLPLGGPINSKSGILTVNHEYTNPEIMFPKYNVNSITRNQVDVQLAAHGLSCVEVERRDDEWIYHRRSRFNRRITAETFMEITGPAAGAELLKTSYDPSGSFVFGTLNNCAGGITPWGTLLTCEENFNQYFANRNSLPASDVRTPIHSRYGLPPTASDRRWELFHDRFDLAKEPNEPFRFGWVVEIDPYDPTFIPKKRTALGRLKHEAATSAISSNRLAVIYSGDDERFDYMYKFVSRRKVSRTNRESNLRLLDDGTLFVARFKDDGTGEWLPLLAGQGVLANWSLDDILINTRGAGDQVGATRMDRPEDIEVNPVNGKVYAVMTNNTNRGTAAGAVNAANPRANNRHGHIIEITEDGGDYAARTFKWEIFMLAGDPNNTVGGVPFFAGFDASKVSPISSPDNISFDNRGNLWIATDGQPGTLEKHDGIYAVPVAGPDRGFVRQFLSGVIASETTGLLLTPNNETLFVSIQHPGEDSSFENPSSTFPDGTTPPRPSVIAITKTGSGPRTIGS